MFTLYIKNFKGRSCSDHFPNFPELNLLVDAPNIREIKKWPLIVLIANYFLTTKQNIPSAPVAIARWISY